MPPERVLVTLTLTLSIALIPACTFVELKPQAEKVRILSAQEVARCRHLGKVTANTAATVGFIARGRDSVKEEIQNLAMNNAADMEGDTIVPAGPIIEGEQAFDVYRCINP